MPDEPTNPTGEMPTGAAPTQDPPQTTAQQDPAPTTGDAPETGTEPFDAERAMATIRKLREEAKGFVKAQKELETLRTAQKTREDAELSEKDRLAKRATELETELAREREITSSRFAEYEVKLAASALNIVDPEAAVKLLDLEFDDAGRPVDVEGALKALIEAKPYLIRQDAQAPRAPTNPTNPATRSHSPTARQYTTAEIADRAFYVANKDDIMRALREGRIRD